MIQPVQREVFGEPEKRWIHEHINQLPDIHKIAIILRFWHNFSITEISQVLQWNWSQTDQALNEGMEILKESMTNGIKNIKAHIGELP